MTLSFTSSFQGFSVLTSGRWILLLLLASFQGFMRPQSLSLTPIGPSTQLFVLPPREGHGLEHAAKFQILSFSPSQDPRMEVKRHKG